MKNKNIKKKIAKENIQIFFNLIKSDFCPKMNKNYLKEILKISRSFNIRLSRKEKLSFCKKCLTPWNVNTHSIRFNSNLGCKEYICKNCGFVRRFKYK